MERYYQSIAPQYSRHRRIHPEVLRCLVSLVQLGAGSAVLEIGCGTGNYISAVRETVGCECWGVDPAEAMLAEARRRSSAVRFIRASAQEMELPGDRFDLVFAVDVVHHLADRPRAFAECRRILRPGGKLCLVTESAAMIRRREPHASYFPQAVEIELAPLARFYRRFSLGLFPREVDPTTSLLNSVI